MSRFSGNRIDTDQGFNSRGGDLRLKKFFQYLLKGILSIVAFAVSNLYIRARESSVAKLYTKNSKKKT